MSTFAAKNRQKLGRNSLFGTSFGENLIYTNPIMNQIMIISEEQFTLLMLNYLEGTASRTERIQLMNALGESDEFCSLFNDIMALEKMSEKGL